MSDDVVNEAINWPDAFSKFGYGDGDSEVHTALIAAAIKAKFGYKVARNWWGLHNEVIDSITDVDGKELIPETILSPQWADDGLGYVNPRNYLPEEITEYLDSKYDGEWYL